jgi:hypothetical protein
MIGMILGLILLGLGFHLSYLAPKFSGEMAVGSLVLYVGFFAIGMVNTNRNNKINSSF